MYIIVKAVVQFSAQLMKSLLRLPRFLKLNHPIVTDS
jgi:hypothetical protein